MARTDINKHRAYMRAWKHANRAKLRAYKCRRKPATIIRAAFINHRCSANRRDIAFLLSFEEWWSIWEASGKWEQRGCSRDRYVMARSGDSGPYAIGNVRICTVQENRADQARYISPETRKRKSEATKARYAPAV